MFRTGITLIDTDRYYFRGVDATELTTHYSYEEIAEWLWTGDLRPGIRFTAPAEALAAARRTVGALPAHSGPTDRLRVAVVAAAAADPLRFDLARGRARQRAEPDPDPGRRAADRCRCTCDDRRRGRFAPARAGAPSLAETHRPTGRRAFTCRTGHGSRPADRPRSGRLDTGRAGRRIRPRPSVRGGLRGPRCPGGPPARRREQPGSQNADRGPGAGQRNSGGRGPSPHRASGARTRTPALHRRGSARTDAVRQARGGPAGGARAGRGARRGHDDRAPHPLHANIDLALAVLSVASGMSAEAGETVFAVSRTAGWIAHALEEYGERPLRMRPSGQYGGPAHRSHCPPRDRSPRTEIGRNRRAKGRKISTISRKCPAGAARWTPAPPVPVRKAARPTARYGPRSEGRAARRRRAPWPRSADGPWSAAARCSS